MANKRSSPQNELVRRVADIESRLKSLEEEVKRSPASADPQLTASGRPWAVDVLSSRKGEPFEKKDTRGSIVYAGSLSSPATGSVVWQIERPVPPVMENRWDAAAPLLASLGHPVRLEIVRRLLTGARTSQELQEIADLRTTGRLYHHLRDLLASGVIVSPRRNHYAIPSHKIVPCLIIVTAASELASQVSAAEEEGKASG